MALEVRAKVNKCGHDETPDDSGGHDAAKVFNNQGQTENTSEMKNGGSGKSKIPR
jgi:hypothetical protein